MIFEFFKRDFFFTFIFIGAFMVVLAGCANPVPPTGGIEDTIPPKVDSIKSTANFQTNFNQRRIELTFDEWIKLQDVFQQVVISPPLENQPEITLRGKTVRIELPENEDLRSNATYTINFGEAVRDITEGNVAENLRFVFSTGDFIDSLELTGRLLDAFTGEPVENALLMLYENTADSVVKTQRPFYFAKTGKEGNFTISNVRADTFKAFALLDANYDYLYNQPDEKIGFPDALIVVADTVSQSLKVKMFTETAPLRLLEARQPHYGLVVLKFNRKPWEYNLVYDIEEDKIAKTGEADSLEIWYDSPELESWSVYISQDTILDDTIKVNAQNREKFIESDTLMTTTAAKGRKTRGREESSPTGVLPNVNQNPDRPLIISFNHPIRSLDTTLMRILEDTTATPVKGEFVIAPSNRKAVEVRYRWKEEKLYKVELLLGAVTDWFGLENDTIRQPITVMPRKALGSMKIVVEDLNLDKYYLLQLLSRNEEVVAEYQINEVKMFEAYQKSLPPGDYRLVLVEDRNGNGRWDPGNYNMMLQSEKVFIKDIETLRANWEVEVKMTGTVFETGE